ncbi:hypothetical protein HanIR_Chr10g0464351 [Helianthus annuus]|nr:hypothetical protein HanIR_Chr10g0464351 [Helianthus annuus]KAJ0696142.1 hypothetical protein HanLR1_Chr10g0353541 [Helianthus annuus]
MPSLSLKYSSSGFIFKIQTIISNLPLSLSNKFSYIGCVLFSRASKKRRRSSPNSTSSLISRSTTRFHSNSNNFNTTTYQFSVESSVFHISSCCSPFRSLIFNLLVCIYIHTSYKSYFALVS